MRWWRPLVALCAFAVLCATYGWRAEQAFGQQPDTGQELRLDLNMDNGTGPCDIIDDVRRVEVGDTLNVAVCLIDAPEPPAVVTYAVYYDDRVVLAPNIGACDGVFGRPDDIFATPVPGSVASREEALDCNPDANAGKTTFGEASLGEGWDCTSGGAIEPWGNRTGLSGDAFNGGCISPAGPYTLPPTGVLGVLQLEVVGAGRTTLALAQAQITGASGVETGSCVPAFDAPMHCGGGLIQAGVGDDVSESFGEEDDEGGSFPWWRVAVGSASALLVLAGLWIFVRTRLRRA